MSLTKGLQSVLLIISLCATSVFGGEESVVQIVLKRPINVISDKFISFTIDPNDLYDVQKQQRYNLVYKSI